MTSFLTQTENLISGTLPFVFLVASGVYLTIKSGFFQFYFLPLSIKHALGGIFKSSKAKNGVSPFQAACTAISATVGTGNIAGVAGALALGGAGAVFWMWITAFAGMCVKSTEIILALEYREKRGKEFVGGPMYYIKNGLSKAFLPLAFVFSLVGMVSAICSGNLIQTNSAITSVGQGFSVKLTGGILFAFITGAVIIGGAKRIGLFTERIVPFMAVLYTLMALGIIMVNIDFLPEAFIMIFKGAFNPKAVTGGSVASVSTAIMLGSSRGVFSNEAGLGTSAIAHSAAEKEEGVKQSLYGIFEVFADTVVMCTLTALTILCSRVNIDYGNNASTELVQNALSTLYGNSSGIIVGIMMCLFGISSVIGWGYYGIVFGEYILGKKGKNLFIIIYPFFCILGALCSTGLVWRLSAFFNGLMLCINMVAVMLLANESIDKMVDFRKKKVN